MRHNHGLRAQSGAAWTPALIATDLWLDAADSASITTVSGAVSQWSDKSGKGNHAVQATASKRPTVSSTGFNGKPAIDFDGVDDSLACASATFGSLGDFFFAAVFQYGNSHDNQWAPIIGHNGDEEAGDGGNVYIQRRSTTNELGAHNAGLVDTGVFVNTADFFAPRIATLARYGPSGGNGATLIVSATEPVAGNGYVTRSSQSWTTTENTSRLQIGGKQQASTKYADVVISEVIAIAGPVGDDIRLLIEGYLAHKWGITARLPVEHIYRNSPPLAGSLYFDNTTLLIAGDGTNGAQNNIFVDSSPNNATLTRLGNVTQGSFSPFSVNGATYLPAVNGGSAYFDGSGDQLITSAPAGVRCDQGDWTFEGWVYPGRLANTNTLLSLGAGGSQLYVVFTAGQGDGALWAGFGNGSWGWVGQYPGNAGAIKLGQWNHFAYVRSGSNLLFFANGVACGSVTNANFGSAPSGTLYIGSYFGDHNADNSWYSGRVSGLRFVNGSALYTGSTYNVPASPPVSNANTKLLLNFTNAGVVDATGNNVLETVGNVQISATQKKFGTGALYFDGSGDYLHIQPSDLLTLGTTNFTVEFWVKAQNQSAFYPTAIGSAAGAWGSGAYSFQIDHQSHANKLSLYANGNESPILVSATNVCDDAWHHCAVTREGNTWRCFIDGVLEATNTTRTDFLGSSTLATRIGFDNWNGANGYFLGYLDDLRITKGVARYTANFTPPSSAFPLS